MQNHKITVVCGENEFEVDGVFGGRSDEIIKVLFKDTDDVNVIMGIASQEQDKIFTLYMFNPLEGIMPLISRIINSGENHIVFRIIEECSLIQRRQYYKIKTNMYTTFDTLIYTKSKKFLINKAKTGKYFKIANGSKIVGIRTYIEPIMIRINEPLNVRIDDFSGGGLLFVSNKKIKVGRILLYTFKDGNMCFNVKAEILRIKKKNSGDYAYGCKFVGIKRREEEYLCSYVFKKQAENIKRS
ncbi:MAG: PilZ domain-containing protein [Oscillospiraceae bacterium]